MTAWWRGAVPSRWRGTSARPTGCRSRRSPTALVAHQPRSRPTSTTRPETRRGRSRRATWACAAAAAPTPSRTTARTTPTRIAGHAIPARSSDGGRGSAYSRRCAHGHARYGRLPSSYDWSRTRVRVAETARATHRWELAASKRREPAIRNLRCSALGLVRARNPPTRERGLSACQKFPGSRFSAGLRASHDRPRVGHQAGRVVGRGRSGGARGRRARVLGRSSYTPSTTGDDSAE